MILLAHLRVCLGNETRQWPCYLRIWSSIVFGEKQWAKRRLHKFGIFFSRSTKILKNDIFCITSPLDLVKWLVMEGDKMNKNYVSETYCILMTLYWQLSSVENVKQLSHIEELKPLQKVYKSLAISTIANWF